MTPKELKEIRALLGLTQQQLAERIGVTRQAVKYWELGLRRIHPPIANLVKTFLLNGGTPKAKRPKPAKVKPKTPHRT